MSENEQNIRDIFSYKKPTPEKQVKFEALRNAAINFGLAIDEHCPPSADRTAAMRQVQDALMTANRAVANDGAGYYGGSGGAQSKIMSPAPGVGSAGPQGFIGEPEPGAQPTFNQGPYDSIGDAKEVLFDAMEKTGEWMKIYESFGDPSHEKGKFYIGPTNFATFGKDAFVPPRPNIPAAVDFGHADNDPNPPPRQ